MSWQDNLKRMLNTRNTAKDIFKSFMRTNGYYDKFETNITSMVSYIDNKIFDRVDDYLSRVHPSQYLMYSFEWSASPEGMDYWNNIDNGWKDYWKNTGIHKCSNYVNIVAYEGGIK